ncbi:hypothetical protein GCM10027046_39380 [Uliginosibacterium flavum]
MDRQGFAGVAVDDAEVNQIAHGLRTRQSAGKSKSKGEQGGFAEKFHDATPVVRGVHLKRAAARNRVGGAETP